MAQNYFESLQENFTGDIEFMRECEDYRQEQWELVEIPTPQMDDEILEKYAEWNQSANENQQMEDSK